MTLHEVQSNVDQWIKTYGQRYFNELTNTALLMEEVGELARLMARQYGEQSFKPSFPQTSMIMVMQQFFSLSVFFRILWDR